MSVGGNPELPQARPAESVARGRKRDDDVVKWVVISLLLLLALLLVIVVLAALESQSGESLVGNGISGQGRATRDVGKGSGNQKTNFKGATNLQDSEERSIEENEALGEAEALGSFAAEVVPSDAVSELDITTPLDNAIGGVGENENRKIVPMAGFFGISSEGKSIVYVIDRSGSMVGGPLERAKDELIRSVAQLGEDQRFQVILFDEQVYLFRNRIDTAFSKPTGKTIQELRDWLSLFQDGSGTEPFPPIRSGLHLKPDVMYLLTDGQFPMEVVSRIQVENQSDTVINTIAFGSNAGEDVLKEIASQNRGTYLHVK